MKKNTSKETRTTPHPVSKEKAVPLSAKEAMDKVVSSLRQNVGRISPLPHTENSH